jgi:uncharacterized DUF497 family protein
VRFEWDETKNAVNEKKHGLDFESGVRVFDDPNFLLAQDRIGESGEQRWRAMGLVAGERLLVVVHVYREAENGEEIIRIISARKASQSESRGYFS